MNTFNISAKLKHDGGNFNLSVVAVTKKLCYVSALEKGIKLITESEKCPESAIKKISISLQQ